MPNYTAWKYIIYDWITKPKNRPFVAIGGIAILLMFIWVIGFVTGVSNNRTPESSPSETALRINSTAADERAKSELKKFLWVKDVYVSPGYMNVGVIRGEKIWTSPMIGQMVCGILRKTGSGLTSVRFVDIEEVAYQQKSPRQSEIHSLECN